MKTRVISALCAVSAAAIISTATPILSSAQQTDDRKVQKTITLRAQRGVTARGGADPNIKQDEAANEPNVRGSIDHSTRFPATRGISAIELFSQKGETARGGSDPNIKDGNATNDLNKRSSRPVRKGGKGKTKS